MPSPPKPANSATSRSIMARVWRDYLSPQRAWLGLALASAAAVAVLTGVLTAWLDPAIELLFNGKSGKIPVPDLVASQPLVWVPAVFVALSLARFVAQRGLATSVNRVGHRLVGRIQTDLFATLVRADLGRLQATHTGQHLSSVLYDAGLMREAATNGVVNSVQHGLIVAASLAVMATQDLVMTVIVLLSGPVIAVVLSGYLARTRKAAKGAMDETASLSTAIMESLDGIRIIKISNREADEEARVNAVIERRQSHVIKGANARAVAAPATEMLTGIVMAMIIAYAGWRSQSGGMGLGGFTAFLAALLAAGQSLRQLANLQTVMSEGMTAAHRLFAALDIKPEITESPGAKPLLRDFAAIAFEQAGFGYGDAGPVLSDITFRVTAGQSVALVGPSGAGKSTLLNLLPRFYDLSTGDIRFDDLSLRDLSIASLRARIALVTQDPFLFDDTIRANIAYGRPGASDADLIEAAKDAAAHEFISALPEGYDTRVGEAGSRLSGGQKQRIAIARAFLKDAPLLLLDEATSALDTRSEQQVQAALTRLMKGRTTFIVAHRLSTVKDADLIVVLDHGRIVEQGTHASLMRARGLYARLAGSQGDGVPVEDGLATTVTP